MGNSLNLKDLDAILKKVTSRFRIVYIDFNCPEFAPYRKRKIGGIVRFDERTIYFHRGLSEKEEKLTWLHEILSIYYYEEGILRHDDEIEKEARKLYDQLEVRSILKKYIDNLT
ncbi:hypothetical protein J7J45_02260 [Candidatus Aerophobetes bacterium]|nr:hypothetical protein [Candidatus Aerophobetes bacterium]